jgi:hypothetical protein
MIGIEVVVNFFGCLYGNAQQFEISAVLGVIPEAGDSQWA